MGFKEIDKSFYRGFHYESDEAGQVCVFNRYMEFIASFETTKDADAFVDSQMDIKYGKA